MAHQEINISAHTNHDGFVHLDIPTDIIDSDIRLKVSFEAVEQASKKSEVRVPGIDKGRFTVPEDFDEPLSSDMDGDNSSPYQSVSDLIGSIDSRLEPKKPASPQTPFQQAIIDKLSDQGIQLP